MWRNKKKKKANRILLRRCYYRKNAKKGTVKQCSFNDTSLRGLGKITDGLSPISILAKVMTCSFSATM